MSAEAEGGKPGGSCTSPPAKTWYEQIFDELEVLAPKQKTQGYFDVDQQPPWVVQVVGELCQQVSPAVKLRQLKKISPKGLGLHLGQQCANLYAVGDKLETVKSRDLSPEQVEAKSKAVLKVLEANQDMPGASSLLKAMSLLGEGLLSMEDAFPKFEEILQRAFKDALDQSYDEAAQFFSGFAAGLSKKGIAKSGPARGTTSTLIYQKMFTHWREIEKLGSVRELRDFLILHGVSGQLIGQPKRLEKICERLGKSFRPPGRPSKSENTDTTTS